MRKRCEAVQKENGGHENRLETSQSRGDRSRWLLRNRSDNWEREFCCRKTGNSYSNQNKGNLVIFEINMKRSTAVVKLNLSRKHDDRDLKMCQLKSQMCQIKCDENCCY